MGKRHLFICDTPFQIMMTLAFRITLLRDDQVEIIISDIVANSEKLYENIKGSNVFDSTYYLRDYGLNYGKQPKGNINRLKQQLKRGKIISELLPLQGKYDAFYATDTLKSTDWLYEILIKNNSKMKMYYFEEGPIAVLCDQGNHFKKRNEYGSKKSKFIDKLLNRKHINGNYTGAYVSVKNQMPKKYFEWYEMPKIAEIQRKEYVNKLNKFWRYCPDDTFKNKIVYLEESFFTDGKENRDMEIVNDLSSYFAKEKLVIKLHPRTRVNRFKDTGIKTYQDTTVPWELIALNGGLEGTVLICMGSGSILYPKLYWGIEQYAVGLLNCQEYHYDYLDDKYYRLFAKVCKERKLAFLPENKEQLFRILERYR